MCDESFDIAVFKKLIIYVKIVVKGKVHIEFAKNVDVADGKADTIHRALTQFIEEQGIPPTKVAGFGSDGAAVMKGSRNGVG